MGISKNGSYNKDTKARKHAVTENCVGENRG